MPVETVEEFLHLLMKLFLGIEKFSFSCGLKQVELWQLDLNWTGLDLNWTGLELRVETGVGLPQLALRQDELDG